MEEELYEHTYTQEFCVWKKRFDEEKTADEEMQIQFQMFDADGNGKISRQELLQAFTMQGGVCLLPAVCCLAVLLSAVCCLLSAVCCLLSVCCLLFAGCSMMP